VNRLIAQARNIDDWDAHVEAFAALGALFDRAEVVERLEELANDAGLLPGWRMAAVVAFEHLRGGDRARQLLAELLPSCYGDAVRLAASIAVRLGASAVEQVRQRVLDLTDEPDADTDDLVLAAEVMRDLALADETAALAKTIMRAPASQPDHLSRAADAWYNACGDVAIGAIVELAEARPGWDHAGKARMATVLARIGVTNVAASLAESVLQSDPDDGVATEDAIAALLAARGAESIAAALTVVDRWCEGSRLDELWHVGGMLKRIAQTAPDPGVVSRVQLLLGSKASMRIGAEALIDAWLTVEGVAAAVPVMDLTERGAALQEYDRGEVAELLQKVGANAEATELAESTLQGQIGTRNIFRQAASVLLNINETTAASRLISLAKQDAWLPPEWFAGVMDALDRDGTTSQAEEALIQVADRLAAHPRAESAELRDALGMLLLYGHPSTAIEFVTEETVKRRELYINHRLDLAEGMAAVGEAESAKVVWRNILVWQEYAAKYEVQMLEEIRAAGETQWAAEQIRTLIAQMDLPAIRKARLHQMLAWLTIGGEAHYSGSHAGETVESR
jgi:hypothetical protein